MIYLFLQHQLIQAVEIGAPINFRTEPAQTLPANKTDYCQ
jgi:hypothetical protein